MSGDFAPIFRSKFKTVNKIGDGTFGEVYKAIIEDKENNELELVVKEAYLTDHEEKSIRRTLHNRKWGEIKKISYPRENRVLDLVNQLLLSHRCPNFLYVYNFAMCVNCKINRWTKTSGSCYVTFMELADMDFTNLFNGINQMVQLSILFQLLMGLYAIHRYYGIWHRDIKAENILIQKIKPGGYFEYVIEGKSYYIENLGFVAYISDFGVVEVTSPIYSFPTGPRLMTYYGSRNAEVMKADDGHLYFEPIIIPGRPRIFWDSQKGCKYGTNNLITDTTEVYNASRPIDLNNIWKFPPFEFFNDIQDVLHVFAGGNRMCQPGSHRGALPQVLRPYFQDKNALIDIYKLYKIHDSVKYILANQMLDYLYVDYKPYSKLYIIDKFVM